MLTKEHVEERIKELEASRDQTRASLIAHEGAIQEMKALLSKFDVKEE